jgi:hypothetical protein
MSDPDGAPEIQARRVQAIRDEMRFEVTILHDRVNALVSAEAFLIISFTMSLAYAGEGPSGRFFAVAPLLAVIGFVLAMLAWPGVNRSVAIIVEWNILLLAALKGARADPGFVWRPSVDIAGDARTQARHRNSMLFTRCVPAVFALSWIALAAVVLTAPMRHP